MPHPYKKFPDRNFWKKSVSTKPWHEVLGSERGKFQIIPTDLISTGGSCFAQRIAHHLKIKGYGYTTFEPPHPLMDGLLADKLGYNTFSARYGNIYTPRQLKQLVDQAFGICEPIFEIERAKSGKFVDLLRPSIHDGGFTSYTEAVADRLFHLNCVKTMFMHSKVFIFTLGLTEAWADKNGEVIYGVHPNVSTGLNIRPDAISINFDYIDCYNDMVNVISFLREINNELKFIFTISPVALAATHQKKHVLTATVYSKSVLSAME